MGPAPAAPRQGTGARGAPYSLPPLAPHPHPPAASLRPPPRMTLPRTVSGSASGVSNHDRVKGEGQRPERPGPLPFPPDDSSSTRVGVGQPQARTQRPVVCFRPSASWESVLLLCFALSGADLPAQTRSPSGHGAEELLPGWVGTSLAWLSRTTSDSCPRCEAVATVSASIRHLAATSFSPCEEPETHSSQLPRFRIFTPPYFKVPTILNV